MIYSSQKYPELLGVLTWLGSNLAAINDIPIMSTLEFGEICQKIGIKALKQLDDSILADACRLF